LFCFVLFCFCFCLDPELAAELKRRVSGKLPEGWEALLPRYKAGSAAEATRRSSGKALNALAKTLPELMGGSADLNPSCFTYLDGYPDFQKKTPEGRNLRFGVREHAMAAILNGMAAYGAYIPYGSTFLNFIGYAYGAVILSALSHLNVRSFLLTQVFCRLSSSLRALLITIILSSKSETNAPPFPN